MPKPNREIATTAKGSGGSQRGTLCRWEALTSAATTAAIATPKKIPRARFGCLRQAAPHKARNSTRPLICSHIAMIEKSSRRRDSWRLGSPRSYSTSTPGRAESALARVKYRAHGFRCWCRQDAGQAPRSVLTNSVRSRPDCSPRRAGRKCTDEPCFDPSGLLTSPATPRLSPSRFVARQQQAPVRPRAVAAATNPTRRTHPQRCRRRRTATLASGLSATEGSLRSFQLTDQAIDSYQNSESEMHSH
jgi:hypothetical protein